MAAAVALRCKRGEDGASISAIPPVLQPMPDGRNGNGCVLLPAAQSGFPRTSAKGPCLNAHIGKCMAVVQRPASAGRTISGRKGAVHLIRYGKNPENLTQRMEKPRPAGI